MHIYKMNVCVHCVHYTSLHEATDGMFLVMIAFLILTIVTLLLFNMKCFASVCFIC